MILRNVSLVALLTIASAGAAVAQAPAPAAPPSPRAARPARPAPAPGTAAPAAPAAPSPAAADAAPPPPPAAPAPPNTPSPRRENQSTNVRVDVTVTDQRPGAAVLTKTVSVMTGDGLNGSVRSQTSYQAAGAGPASAPFNVDTLPVILADGKINLRLIVQYDVVPPPVPGTSCQPGAPCDTVRLMGTSIRDSVSLILETGKPLVAVQSSDPVSDRKVSVEVKATILR